jgi:hypothetical protein
MRLTGEPMGRWMVRGIPEQLKNEFVRFWNRNKGLMVSKLDWLDKQAWRHTKNDEEINQRSRQARCRIRCYYGLGNRTAGRSEPQ